MSRFRCAGQAVFILWLLCECPYLRAPEYYGSLFLKLERAFRSPGNLVEMQLPVQWVWGGIRGPACLMKPLGDTVVTGPWVNLGELRRWPHPVRDPHMKVQSIYVAC